MTNYNKSLSLIETAFLWACKPSASATPNPATLQLMGDLLSGNWNRADLSEVKSRREASGLVAAYLQWHLERGLKSLPYVERNVFTTESAI